MAALTADKARDGKLSPYDMKHDYGISASEVVFAGSAVVLNGGFAEAASAATGLVAIGVAIESVTGGSSDGDTRVRVKQGIFKFANSAGGDAIAAADRWAACYLVDDDTVAKTDGSSSRSRAGIIYDIADDGEVFVLMGLGV